MQVPVSEVSLDTHPGVLDVRSREEFLKLHVCGSANIPNIAVADRLFELPPPRGGADEPEVKLVIVHELEHAQLEDLKVFLTEKGYTVEECIRGSELVVGGKWPVECGKSFGCLWKPNPALSLCWEKIKNVHNDPKTRRLTCIDLAAGKGKERNEKVCTFEKKKEMEETACLLLLKAGMRWELIIWNANGARLTPSLLVRWKSSQIKT